VDKEQIRKLKRCKVQIGGGGGEPSRRTDSGYRWLQLYAMNVLKDGEHQACSRKSVLVGRVGRKNEQRLGGEGKRTREWEGVLKVREVGSQVTA